ncbi:MAG: hypothetical protein KJO38_03685, partial [Gammaproteobacteria bacterium]|nr:hypothetical protein [Gammaproteobacteria bacterium]
YLVAWSRTFERDNEDITNTINSVFSAIIDEDIDAIEAVEKIIAGEERPRERLVNADAHALQCRRIMKKLFAEQAESNVATASAK